MIILLIVCFCILVFYNQKNFIQKDNQNSHLNVKIKIPKPSVPIWDMPYDDLQYQCADKISVSKDIILTSCVFLPNQSQFTFIDKDGFKIEHITLVGRDIGNVVAQTNSYIFFGNRVFDKKVLPSFENGNNLKIYKTLPYEFNNICPLEHGFATSDKENVLRYFDENLKLKWEKKFDTHLIKYAKIDNETQNIKESLPTSVIKDILKSKDGDILVLIKGAGFERYDLKGNLIDKKQMNLNYIDLLAYDDEIIFTLEGELFVYQGQLKKKIKLVKYDYDGYKFWEKDLKIYSATDTNRLIRYNQNLLLISSVTDFENEKMQIEFIEYDLKGNKLDENIAKNYPKRTDITSTANLINGDILLGGTMLYFDNEKLLRNALFIKISSDIPLGKQQIRKFDE